MKQKLKKETCSDNKSSQTHPARVSHLLPWIESGEYLTPKWQQKLDEIIKRSIDSPEIPDKYLAIPSGKSLI